MAKLVIRFILFLCILLLSGYSQLYAHTYQNFTCHAPIKILKSSAQATFATLENSRASVVRSAYAGKEEKIHIELNVPEIEEENDKWFSFKKHVKSSYYFTAFFYAHILGHFLNSITKSFPSGEHFSYSQSYRRHLLFQVFRI